MPSGIPVTDVEVVVAHRERATVRVGDVFLKIDTDATRVEIEVDAVGRVPVPTPRVLWHQPPVLALAEVPGTALGRLGEPSTASPEAWRAAGEAVRRLHDAPAPLRVSRNQESLVARIDDECAWLVDHDVLPVDLVTRNRRIAERAIRPWEPVFVHGDLQVAHVFTDAGHVTGIIDWSEAGRGDALYDLATLTLGHPEHLPDVIEGYGRAIDTAVVAGWWAMRSLGSIRWLSEHGFDPAAPGCEIDVLRRAR